MQKIALKLGHYKIVALITVASITTSVLISYLLMRFFSGSLDLTTMLVSIITPLIVAPIASWYVVGLLFKLHELEQVQRNLATYDTLTGLMSRRVFLENSEILLKIMVRNKQRMTLAFIDIDNFKMINDLYGHAGGDEVLKSFATILLNSLRESDLVGRIGGEEFSIILPNTSLENSIQVLESIRVLSENNSVEYSNKTIQYTISIGVVLFHETNQVNLDMLIRQSDIALYSAKKSGKNCVVEYQANTRL